MAATEAPPRSPEGNAPQSPGKRFWFLLAGITAAALLAAGIAGLSLLLSDEGGSEPSGLAREYAAGADGFVEACMDAAEAAAVAPAEGVPEIWFWEDGLEGSSASETWRSVEVVVAGAEGEPRALSCSFAYQPHMTPAGWYLMDAWSGDEPFLYRLEEQGAVFVSQPLGLSHEGLGLGVEEARELEELCWDSLTARYGPAIPRDSVAHPRTAVRTPLSDPADGTALLVLDVSIAEALSGMQSFTCEMRRGVPPNSGAVISVLAPDDYFGIVGDSGPGTDPRPSPGFLDDLVDSGMVDVSDPDWLTEALWQQARGIMSDRPADPGGVDAFSPEMAAELVRVGIAADTAQAQELLPAVDYVCGMLDNPRYVMAEGLDITGFLASPGMDVAVPPDFDAEELARAAVRVSCTEFDEALQEALAENLVR